MSQLSLIKAFFVVLWAFVEDVFDFLWTLRIVLPDLSLNLLCADLLLRECLLYVLHLLISKSFKRSFLSLWWFFDVFCLFFWLFDCLLWSFTCNCLIFILIFQWFLLFLLFFCWFGLNFFSFLKYLIICWLFHAIFDRWLFRFWSFFCLFILFSKWFLFRLFWLCRLFIIFSFWYCLFSNCTLIGYFHILHLQILSKYAQPLLQIDLLRSISIEHS